VRHGKPTATYRTWRTPVARSGFSLLEMTVVIGIIMLLMAIAIIGYRYIESKNAGDATRTALHNADSMVAELDRTGQGWRLEGPGGYFTPVGRVLTISLDFSGGDVSRTGNGRVAANTNCSNVLQRLLQVQANQDAYGKLPSKGLIAGSGNPNTNPPLPAAMADAWGNPMVWVPSGGLNGVRLKSSSDANGNVTYGSNGITIKSPDGRGFWASGGPDGDLSTGDDNVYSFQK
jgi:type II secretory pathway pseudopilin PulG